MKYLMFILMAVMFSVPVMARDDDDDGYKGQLPNWDTRHTVECTMTTNGTSITNYAFSHGNLDYAQAGMLVVYLQSAQFNWYEDISDWAEENPGLLDPGLVPDPNKQIRALIEIERLMSGKFDER